MDLPTTGINNIRATVNICNLLIRALAVLIGLSVAQIAAANESDLWHALKGGGHVALLRHALAPGIGDPADFRLEDCSTQRNLSAEGRSQATKIGDRFRQNGILNATVYSSQWCRCIDTAELLGLGPVEPLETINSFFQNFENQEPQTLALENWIRTQSLNQPIVLVTHQVNITALTGVYLASGELVIVKVSDDEPMKVIGTLQSNSLD